MRLLRLTTLCCLALFCVAGIASASSISGSYTFSFTGQAPDASGCSAYAPNTERNSFSGSGTNTIGGTSSVTISDCDGSFPNLGGGEFSITGAAGTLDGTVSGVFAGTALIGSNIFYLDEGTFTVSSESGAYIGVPTTGVFISGTDAALEGFVDLSTPEPASIALSAMGALLMGALIMRRRSS